VSPSPNRSAWLGTALLAGSALAYSTAGFFTRLITVDAWTMLFWRGVFGGLFLAAFILWRERGHVAETVRATGLEGLGVGLGSAVATICFLNALRLTSVADVMVVGATVPFFTAAFAWFLIGERERATTLVASLFAVLGMIAMMGGALQAGNVAGDLLALAMTVSMALVMVLIRRKAQASMLPAVCLSAFLCAVLVLPRAEPLAVGSRELLLLALFGVTQFGLGLLLLALGIRHVSATRSALINVLDSPLAPVWVWLAFGEVPAWSTVAGGAVVLAAVLGDILLGRSKESDLEQPIHPSHRQADA
jgi:drug/metabolite transporter (DMT)-like permease